MLNDEDIEKIVEFQSLTGLVGHSDKVFQLKTKIEDEEFQSLTGGVSHLDPIGTAHAATLTICFNP